MTTLPEPLVPIDVDLRDFPFMPLDVARLRDSELASNETPEACWAAVLLWAASWHQVPAASVPNDDKWLAKQAGYVSRGKVAREWSEVRIGALRGFVECSDLRLYHPVVAEKAIDAWKAKLRQRLNTECARIKKHNQRHGTSIPYPEFDTWFAAGCPCGHSLPVPGDNNDPSTGHTRSVPRETPSKGEGEGEGQGSKEKEITKLSLGRDRPSDVPPQLSLVEPGPERQKGPPDCPHLHVLALWAEVLPQLPQHEPDQWKGQRADHLRARWRELATSKGWPSQDAGLAYLRRLFAYVGRSPFLTGRVTPRDPNKRPFVVTLAWLVKPENWAKTVEGEYHEESA